MTPVDTTSIINTAINVLPGIIALIKTNHQQQNPDVPALTDEEVTAALHEATAQSLAKGEAWLAAHPSTDPTPGEGGEG